MTDAVRYDNATTQTAMPSIGLDFDQLYRNNEAGELDAPVAFESTWSVWHNLLDQTMDDDQQSNSGRNNCDVNHDIQNR